MLFVGLDDGGKTSIMYVLNKKFSLLRSIKPTKKAKITAQKFLLLGLEIINWDLGGQENFRNIYLQKFEKYFSDVQTIFYVIDIQDSDRFDEAKNYLSSIVDIMIRLNQKDTHFLILLHKCDPDIRDEENILKNINLLQKQIEKANPNISFLFYSTSIYDEPSLYKPFSDGVIAFSHKAKMVETLLRDYMGKSFNSATVILDEHNFIIASRATKPEYETICEEIAPRLTPSMEKLETLNIDTIDIVVRFTSVFPESDEYREGMVFLKKIDLKEERLYLVALCLNHKVKTRSYDLLPQLASNLRELLESY